MTTVADLPATLAAEHEQAAARMAARISGRPTYGTSARELRETMRTAIVAQEGRRETFSKGYATEARAFYGGRDSVQCDEAERRLLVAEADREVSRRAEIEREEAEAYRAAQTPVTYLNRGNRRAFVELAPWAAGLSTLDIAARVVAGLEQCPDGWAISRKYEAKVS